MKFKCKEQTKSGEIIEGIKEATDKFAMAKEIRINGNIPLSIVEYKEGGKFSLSKISILGRVSLSEKSSSLII